MSRLLPHLLPHLLLPALAALPLLASAQSAWLFGERHDHADHQRQTTAAVEQLAAQGRLHGLVLEMAERGRDTRSLTRNAGEAQVRTALQWNDAGWPWQRYGDVVMAAVRAGVPVHGGNLARPMLREAMQQPRWDGAIPPDARARLVEAVREGHCHLLPESQLDPMVRMQVARDHALAQSVADAAGGAGPDDVVVLLAGAAHASRATGVPLHLPALAPQLQVRSIGFASSHAGQAEPGFDDWRPAATEPPQDHCAALRERGMPSSATPPASTTR